MNNSGTVTLLFTDLVNSTDLLKRFGDEKAQRVFAAHRKILSDAVEANSGREVKWLGDGLMVAFPSTADAVRCAIVMQQRARRPVSDVRLGTRVGLHVGEAMRERDDYFGSAVVMAQRLCGSAAAGQILASTLVSGLLAGRPSFRFRDCGSIGLKELGTSPVCEVLYEPDDPVALLHHTPFVGRMAELSRLEQKLEAARAGAGALAMIVGEPGIGKTRTMEQFVEAASKVGALVLWGVATRANGHRRSVRLRKRFQNTLA